MKWIQKNNSRKRKSRPKQGTRERTPVREQPSSRKRAAKNRHANSYYDPGVIPYDPGLRPYQPQGKEPASEDLEEVGMEQMKNNLSVGTGNQAAIGSFMQEQYAKPPLDLYFERRKRGGLIGLTYNIVSIVSPTVNSLVGVFIKAGQSLSGKIRLRFRKRKGKGRL